MNLQQLQQYFQSSVVNSQDEISAYICAPKNLSGIQALQIYQRGYVARISQAMTQDYPVLSYLIGENAFLSLVTDYLKEYPSRDFNLRFIGKNLAQFILSKSTDFVVYSELARLEWMMCEMQCSAGDVRGQKEFKTAFNVVEVWREFQRGQIIELMEFSDMRSYLI